MHKLLLRLPYDLWLELSEQAQSNHRSINSEIVHRLRRSIDGYSR